MSVHCTVNYVELPSPDGAASKTFFHQAFGWKFVDYGPEYAAFEKDGPSGTGLDGGIDSTDGRTGASLVVLKADDLEAALAAVEAAGGEIVRPIFEFPGGRRFHFREPGGNEMAVWGEPVTGAA